MTRSPIVKCIHCKRRLADRTYKNLDRWIYTCYVCKQWACHDCVVFCDSSYHPELLTGTCDTDLAVDKTAMVCEKTCGSVWNDENGEHECFICYTCDAREKQ